ncbi:MAG: hypothetical protein KIH08_08560 [Candidatus Freyarchaeota archaeon]|nr:hypothetical protein [Candidatus Jordarchaeia archaeon]MBS7280523.1 hypothetical protein [Candidatus Jordarchaeia archaeon]
MGVANISQLYDDVRSLLVALFRIAWDIGRLHYGLGREAVKDLEEYTFDSFRALISMTNQSVSTFVSFFENFLKGMIAAYDFLCELFKIVRVRDIEAVILRKVDLMSIVNPSEIDAGLLKFQLKTALEFSLPKVLEISNSLYNTFGNLSDSAKFIQSPVIQNFKTISENLNTQATNLVKELYSTSEKLFREEDRSKCVNLLIEILQKAIDFAHTVWLALKDTPLFTKDLVEYTIDEINQIAERFSQIKRDINIIVKCREKIYEHAINCFMVILKALWSSEKIADEKVFKIMQMFFQTENHHVDVSELIPLKIPFKDLAFAVALSRKEFDLSKTATKRVMEVIESLHLAAEWLQSPVLQLLYESIRKRLELKEKLDEKMLKILLKLQEILKI